MLGPSAGRSMPWFSPGQAPRSNRLPGSRRAALFWAAPWRISCRPGSCRSARRASCRTRPCASPIRSNTASMKWKCTRTRSVPVTGWWWSTT
ncbi:UNVERIFIED_CONTAM: hypothetical protein GTU68_016310 [Idotea baltica]|nr:hypothetical protein [Idotea baltica]